MIDSMNFPLAIREMMIAGSADRDTTLPAMGEEEFRAFYDRTSRPLWSYLSRISGDRHLADDLLQEAYYRFYRAGARHESEAHRRNSLFQIATNLARDVARRGSRHHDIPLEEDDATGIVISSDAPTPERATEMRMDVSRALQKLEPAQRELLWLAYAQGASHEEIAAILGVRAISVRTLLFRARKKLATLLTGSDT